MSVPAFFRPFVRSAARLACSLQPYGHLRVRNWLRAQQAFDDAGHGIATVRGQRIALALDHDADAQLLYLQRDRFNDLWEIDWLQQFLRSGDTFIDIGANIGLHTILCAKHVGPEGRVIAVEPDTDNLACLRRSCGLNGLTNVLSVEAIVVGTKTDIGWVPTSAGQTGHVARDVVAGIATLPCRVLTWPRFSVEHEINHRAVLKMDIEGAEFDVLKTWLDADAVLPRAALVEFHPWHVDRAFEGFRDIVAGLEHRGWSIRLKMAAEAKRWFAGRPELGSWFETHLIHSIRDCFECTRFYAWMTASA